MPTRKKDHPPPKTVGASLRRYRKENLGLGQKAYRQLQFAVSVADQFCRLKRGRPLLLRDLSPAFFVGFCRWLLSARRNAPTTANGKRSALVTIWRFASLDHDWCDPPPRKPLPRLCEPERLPAVWTLEEVRSLLVTARASRGYWGKMPAALCWEMGLSILWDTGARIGELIQASIGELDLPAGIWIVPAEHRKGKRRPKIYRLHPDTLDLVKRSLWWPRDALWPIPWRKERSLWLAFTRLLKAAGIPADRWHKFHAIRRTAESLAASERGIPWAAAAIGHTEAVARRSYVSPLLAPGPALIEALPRI